MADPMDLEGSSNFPETVAFAVLLYSDFHTLRRSLFVCKAWSSVLCSEIFWYSICRTRGYFGQLQPLAETTDQETEDAVKDTLKAMGKSGFDPANYYIPKPKTKATSWRELFFLNLCPHQLSDLSQLKIRWTDDKKTALATKTCSECRVLDIWICLEENCKFNGCGRTKNKHFLDHYEKTGHTLCVNLRELDVWCYKCDRFLGETDAPKDEREFVNNLRRLLLMPQQLYSHRSNLWNGLRG